MPERSNPDGRADWVGVLDRVGYDLQVELPGLVSLSRDELMETASGTTGFSDFGPDDFIEPLDILLTSLASESKLTLLGRILVRADLLNLLQNRLRIADLAKREPAVLDEKIERPLFVIGLPRSGTTILHELLAADPRLRAPLTWEARFPCPPASGETDQPDPRIGAVDRLFDLQNHLVPGFRTIHEVGARLPCECIDLTAHSFRSEDFLARQQTPSYGAWLASADLGPAYNYHRLVLQVLQWSQRSERWVLKAPSHMSAISFLLAEYPDACIVHTHRDPLQSMASAESLLTALISMRASEVDTDLIRQGFAGEGLLSRLNQVIEARERHPDQAARFHDVRFSDLMQTPVDTLRGIYEHFSMEFGAEDDERIRSYLASKPRAKHGRHAYRVEDLNVDAAQERDRFRAYQQRYSVPSETS